MLFDKEDHCVPSARLCILFLEKQKKKKTDKIECMRQFRIKIEKNRYFAIATRGLFSDDFHSIL